MFDRYAAATAPSWGRRALVIASVGLHAAAGIALAIYSIFHVEEIAPPAVSLTFFSAPPPPPPPPPPARKKSTNVEKKVQQTQVVQVKNPVFQQPKPDDKKEKEEDEGEEGGQEGGQKGGQVGGTVGGQVGGTIGGTGTDVNAKPGPARMVAAFTLATQQLAHPLPRLSEDFKSSHPQQTVKGMYKVCLGADGHVTDVTPMTSIPTQDASLIQQIKSSWTYKPQPVPLCFAAAVAFTIN